MQKIQIPKILMQDRGHEAEATEGGVMDGAMGDLFTLC